MCKLMFGEHREKITQIILTAAEENFIFTIKAKLEGNVFSSLYVVLWEGGEETVYLNGSCII